MLDSSEHSIKSINFLNHTAPWPTLFPANSRRPQFVPLTSFYANYTNLRSSRTLKNGSCRGLMPVDFIATDLFQTSFDVVAGSSGGLVITPDSIKRERATTLAPLIGMGILIGETTLNSDGDKHEIWAEPVGLSSPNNYYATNITGTSVDDLKVFERDNVQIPMDDPSKPTPKIEGEYPECEKESEDGKVCEKF